MSCLLKTFATLFGTTLLLFVAYVQYFLDAYVRALQCFQQFGHFKENKNDCIDPQRVSAMLVTALIINACN